MTKWGPLHRDRDTAEKEKRGQKGENGDKKGQKGMKVRRSPSRPYRIYWWLVRVSRLKWLRETTIKWALANHCQLQGRVIFFSNLS